MGVYCLPWELIAYSRTVYLSSKKRSQLILYPRVIAHYSTVTQNLHSNKTGHRFETDKILMPWWNENRKVNRDSRNYFPWQGGSWSGWRRWRWWSVVSKIDQESVLCQLQPLVPSYKADNESGGRGHRVAEFLVVVLDLKSCNLGVLILNKTTHHLL